VGLIIGSKLTYRWIVTKELAKQTKQAGEFLNTTKSNRSFKNKKYDPHDYSPSRFKDYLAIKKGRNKRNDL
jgi:hypothetical protein